MTARRQSAARQAPLDPAILALIDALAIAQAQEDHAAEERAASLRNPGAKQ